MDSFSLSFIFIVIGVVLIFMLWRLWPSRMPQSLAQQKPEEKLHDTPRAVDESPPEALQSRDLTGRLMVRVPIYNANKAIVGYLLNFSESGLSYGKPLNDFIAGVADYIANHLKMAGKPWPKRVFLQIDDKPLDDDILELIPPQFVVLNFKSHSKVSLNIAQYFERLRARDYKIAIPFDPANVPLAPVVPVSNVLWVNLRKHKDLTRLANPLEKIRAKGLVMFAEQVESEDIFKLARANHFQAFDGSLFCMRKGYPKQDVDAATRRFKRIFNVLASNADAEEVEAVISQDEEFASQLLTFINSPRFGLSASVESIAQAVKFVGHAKLMRRVLLALMQSRGVKKNDPYKQALFISALYRGHFMENVLRKLNAPARECETGFMLGLFSQLDQIMDYNMLDVLSEMSVPQEVRDVLLNGSGAMAKYLDLARASESSDLTRVKLLVREVGLNDQNYNELVIQSLFWAEVFARPPG